MLTLLWSGCAAVATGVKMLTDFMKHVVHLNYELVTSVIEAVTHVVTTAVYVYDNCKQLIVIMWESTVDCFLEVRMFLLTISTVMSRFVSTIYTFLHLCSANVVTMCLSCVHYVSSLCAALSHGVTNTFDFLSVSVNMVVSLVVTLATALYLVITTLGSCCIHFVTGVWQGLGFVLSSVASFPTACFQSIKNLWIKTIDYLAGLITVTTKETYLGIVVLCLLYLTLSNTFRYLYSRGLSLFPRRIRRRRTQGNDVAWQFDRGFESDFEDVYNSDADEPSWATLTEADNDGIDDSDDDADADLNDRDSNNSDNVSDADDDSGSEEYTVVTEESDSDASMNSQTFSTESSDHEIDVQLPPVDKCYSSCSRSSTPSRISKTVNSPEEFDREMERERDKRKCVICQDQIKSVLVLPCKHMCMCVLCADQIVRSRTIGRRVCPLCRTRITKVMNIYV